jgi:hypothetical protein
MMENQTMRDTKVRPGGSGMGRRILELVQRRYRARLEDSGQALIMVLIAVLLIAVLVPIIGENVSTETGQVSRDTLSDLALAAAQAGANDYRTYIDNNSQYTGYTCGTPEGQPGARRRCKWRLRVQYLGTGLRHHERVVPLRPRCESGKSQRRARWQPRAAAARGHRPSRLPG